MTNKSLHLKSTFNHLFHLHETTADKCTRVLKDTIDTELHSAGKFLDHFLGGEEQGFMHTIMDSLEYTAHAIIDSTKSMFDDESN